jgi:hypothetical protein
LIGRRFISFACVRKCANTEFGLIGLSASFSSTMARCTVFSGSVASFAARALQCLSMPISRREGTGSTLVPVLGRL